MLKENTCAGCFLNWSWRSQRLKIYYRDTHDKYFLSTLCLHQFLYGQAE
jgi:hypothetical protein